MILLVGLVLPFMAQSAFGNVVGKGVVCPQNTGAYSFTSADPEKALTLYTKRYWFNDIQFYDEFSIRRKGDWYDGYQTGSNFYTTDADFIYISMKKKPQLARDLYTAIDRKTLSILGTDVYGQYSKLATIGKMREMKKPLQAQGTCRVFHSMQEFFNDMNEAIKTLQKEYNKKLAKKKNKI